MSLGLGAGTEVRGVLFRQALNVLPGSSVTKNNRAAVWHWVWRKEPTGTGIIRAGFLEEEGSLQVAEGHREEAGGKQSGGSTNS